MTAPFRQLFFVDGKFLGETERDWWKRRRPHVVGPCSYLFFCPACGEVWAKCPVTQVGTGTRQVQQFDSVRHLCRKCWLPHADDRWQIPGSLLLDFDEEFVGALPEEVLKRELLLAIDLYERTHNLQKAKEQA